MWLDFYSNEIILYLVKLDCFLIKSEEEEIDMTNFRKFRLMNNLRQCEIAKRVGVSSAAVARLDKYGCYDTRTASKYAKALNCNPVYLLDGLSF